MKKFLLTLCVTLLTCIGMWAQDPSGEILLIGDGTTVYNSSNISDFKLEGNNGAGIQAGDKLKVYYRSTNEWFIACWFKTIDDQKDYFNLDNNYKPSWGAEEWGVQVFDVTPELATNIKTYGMHVNGLNNCELLKVTYASAKATSLSASPTSLTMYQGETKDVTVDFTPASAEFTITPSDGNISAVLAGHTLSITAGGETPVGDYTVTVTPQPGSQDAGGNEVQAVTININVKDKSIVETLNAQDVVEVAYGYPITIPVEFTPLTATNFDTPTCDVTGVTLSYSADHQKLTIDASGLSAETNVTITLSAGSISKEITLKVISPVTVGGIVITPSDDQTIAKGATLAVSAQVTPSNAANKDFSWNIDEYNNSIISYKDGVVTGKSRGTQALIATSAENSGITASINITVNEAFEGSINVPASTRVGVNSSSASVNITNGAVAEDYVVTYSSDHPEILEVNSSTGALTPKAEGTAKITAMIEASTAGQAKGFTNATFVSGDISVGAEITGSFETFSMADMALGDQTEYAVADLPSVTWSQTIPNSGSYEYKTQWEIVDESGRLTSLWSINENKLFVAATKTGSTTAKIIAKYAQLDWSSGSAVLSGVMATAEQEFNVTVSGVTGTITLAPQGDITFDSEGNITFDKKLGNQTVNATVNWSDGTTGSAVTIESNNEYANTTPSGLTITIQPVKKGSETVTVKAAWEKDLDYPFGGQKAIAEATPVTFTVNILDETKADVLTFEDGTTSKTVDVAKGYKADVKVKVEPAATAQLHLDKTSEGGVTAEYNAETSTITLTAAAEATGATFTLTDDVKSISVTANIVDPVSVSSIALDETTYTVAKDKTTTATATVLPVDASDLAVVWSSDNEEVFKVVDGVITGVARGTATLTAKSRMDESLFKTATVNVTEELPVTDNQPKSTFGVGETYTSQLTIADMIKGTDYDVTYESSKPEILSVDANGLLTAKAKGTADITVTFEPKNTEATKNYTTWTRTMKVTVKEGVYGISIAADPTQLTAGANGTVNITSEAVTLNNAATTKAKNTDYTVVYSLENASNDITIDAATGSVSIPTTAPVQQFTIVATLEPVEAQKNDYKGAVAKVGVLVAGDASEGVILTKHTETVKDENGDDVEVVTIEVNVPSPGAFGTLGNPNVSTSSTATIEELKAATNVKVTGLIANSDVRQLVDLIGSRSTDDPCKTLDMGSAQMTEAIVYDENGLSLVPAYVTGGPSMASNTKSLLMVQDLTLPQPSPSATVLPKGMKSLTNDYNNFDKNSLTKLTIPNGWTEVADEAFADKFGQGFTGSGLGHVNNISLPNSLIRIGVAAFAGLKVRTLYIPNQVDIIDNLAFSNNTGENEVGISDIYFTGQKAPSFVHEFAFDAMTQLTNKTNNKMAINEDGTTTRELMVKVNVLACLMHYPEGCEAEYIDQTREYYKGDKPHGADDWETRYYPANWNDAATYAKMQAALSDANARNTFVTPLNGDGKVYAGYPDVTYGDNLIWPSFDQYCIGYSLAFAGFTWDGQDMRDNETWMNKKGLYQFVVAVPNAPKDKEEWHFKYEQNKWYTISLPFDMSVEDIKKVFGDKTQVCRISKVIRDTTDPNNKKLRLEFRKSVMGEDFVKGEDRQNNIKYYSDEQGFITSTAVYKAGIRHHHPYMIKPAGTVDSDPSIKFNEATGERSYKGYESLPGMLVDEMAEAETQAGVKTGHEYYFRPILQKGTLKKNSYVLTNKNGVHQFIFYKGAKLKDEHDNYVMDNGKYVYTDGGTATANTAYVQLMHGQEDSDDYFPTGTISGAPKLSFFGDEEDATGIEKIEIVCGAENVANDKIYTIGGQLVNGNNLPAGIYIKNGKKFIVK